MTSAPPPPTILVVDDNAQNRELARAALEDEGLRVCLAEGGQEALEQIQAERPDCVLLDVRMPGMDGFQTCAALRELPGCQDLPVVFLTAQRDLDTFEAALRAGGDEFLTKPVQPASLVLRVRAALKLRRVKEELREQYDMVRRQRDDLVRLHLQKERLSAFLVHDLKNPISAMDLHAQLLLRNRELPESARDSVQRIRTEGRAMLRMVLNLLDISRSEEGTLAPRLGQVDLSAMVRAVLAEFEIRARSAGVELALRGEDVSVQADPDLLQRVIENLVDNAIRHAPEDSTVEVTVALGDGYVELGVADGGPGVPPEMRERIFERFVQTNERQVERSGRGLGLTYCKLAVEAHGGSIWIRDRSPGTVFHVKLPA